ncbi:SERTA domain-containing protein 2-like isoform X1 [Lethenteron reissneri]|uniref:SERTA domain-containing protein 2-like isoform X1 n=2 Tax=Lethenteron reissneri TaxID=7753 RepID=UPI002AB77EC1|nr:SERTA domain-containing protein 2-like isoform X1 [Lethenteron reissneri]
MAIEAKLLSRFAKRKRAGDSWTRDDRGPGPAAMTTSAADDDDDNDDNEMENTEAMEEEEEEWWTVGEDWAEQESPPPKRCRFGGGSGSGGDRPPDSELMQGALCLSIAKMNAYRAHREPCLRRSVLVANMTHRLKKDMRAKRRRRRCAVTAPTATTTPAQFLDARVTTPPIDLATRGPLVPDTPSRAAPAEIDAAAAVRSPAPWSGGEESRRGASAAAAAASAAAPAEAAAPFAWPTEELFWKPSCSWDEGTELSTVSLTDSLLQAAGLSGPDPTYLAMDLSHTLDDIFAEIDTALYDFDLFSPGVLASCAAGSTGDGGAAPVLAGGYGGGESDGSGDPWLRCFPVACGSEASGTPASQWKAELSDLEHIMEVLVGS